MCLFLFFYKKILAREQTTANLSSELGGGVDQVGGNSEADNEKTAPGDEALGSELVGLARRGPGVGGVDGGVAINVSAVLVLELVHTVALALAALGILPVLALHGLRHSHEVLLHGLVLDLVKALLGDVDLVDLHGLDGAVNGGAAAGRLGLQGGTGEGGLGKSSHFGFEGKSSEKWNGRMCRIPC